MNKNKKVKKTKSAPSAVAWIIKVLLISFTLSMVFGIVSEMTLSSAGIALSVVIILVFVLVSVISDMIGVGVTCADPQKFRAMASKKVRGSKQCLSLIKNAAKVSSICCDVVGDVCGILAGAAGASIVLKIAYENTSFMTVFIPTLISAIVATLTIVGKAVMKQYAISHSSKVTLVFGQFLSIFTITKKQSKTKKKRDEKIIEEILEEDDNQKFGTNLTLEEDKDQDKS